MARRAGAGAKGREMSATKAALREQLRVEAARHTSAERREGSQAICTRIAEQQVWRDARSVLGFMPLASEPDLTPLVLQLLAANKTLALPRFDPTSASYQAVQVTDLTAQLERGRYGVLEPRAECPLLSLKELDLALVPGIGFSLNGGRLGRGKGYFDRMLCEVRGWICGVAFDWQVTVEIPSEQHDIHVNSIVTPTRWHVART